MISISAPYGGEGSTNTFILAKACLSSTYKGMYAIDVYKVTNSDVDAVRYCVLNEIASSLLNSCTQVFLLNTRG